MNRTSLIILEDWLPLAEPTLSGPSCPRHKLQAVSMEQFFTRLCDIGVCVTLVCVCVCVCTCRCMRMQTLHNEHPYMARKTCYGILTVESQH